MVSKARSCIVIRHVEIEKREGGEKATATDI